MPDLKDYQEVALWRNRIKAGEKKLDKEKIVWRRLTDLYENKHWPDAIPDEQRDSIRLTINLVWAYIRNIIPSIYIRNPHIYIRARKPESEPRCALIEHLLNYFVDEGGLKKQARYSLLDSFFSFACIKVGYFADMETNANAAEILQDPDTGEILRDPSGLPRLAKGDYLRDENKQPLIDPETREPLLQPPSVLVGEQFFFERISPEHLLFPVMAKNDPEKLEWIVQKITRPLKEVQADKTYKNRSKIKGNGKIAEQTAVFDLSKKYDEDTRQEVEKDAETVDLYEIWDVKERRVKVICDSVDKFLRDDPYPKGVARHPYAILKFNEIPDKFYPEPEMLPSESIQKEYNHTRTQWMLHRKRFGRKYEVQKGTLDEEAQEKLESGDDGTIVQVSQMGNIQPIKDAPLDPVAYSQMPAIKADFQQVMGISGERMGNAEASTATAANIVDQAGQTMIGDKLDQVTDWFNTIARKLLMTMQANLTLPGVVKIEGPDGVAQWQDYSPSRGDLEGEFDSYVEVGSSAPRNTQNERDHLLKFYELTLQDPQAAQILNKPELFKEILERLEIENQRLLLAPTAPMQAQQNPTSSLNPGAMSGGMNAGNAAQAQGGNGAAPGGGMMPGPGMGGMGGMGQ